MRGFSLIELLIVIAIVLALTGMAPGFYSRFILQNAVEDTTNQITNSLRKAQLYSMMSKQGDGWSAHYDNTSHIVVLYKGVPPYLAGPYDEKFDLNPNVTLNSNHSTSHISFAKVTGLPSITSDIFITISAPGNHSETITINTQGVVSR